MLIDLDKEFKKYNIFPRGFIQVGAHIGQEVKVFKNLNSKANIYLFEPQEELFQKLKLKYENDKYVALYNYALGDSKQTQTMYKDINNDSQSSSILKPKDHLKYHSILNLKKTTEKQFMLILSTHLILITQMFYVLMFKDMNLTY